MILPEFLETVCYYGIFPEFLKTVIIGVNDFA